MVCGASGGSNNGDYHPDWYDAEDHRGLEPPYRDRNICQIRKPGVRQCYSRRQGGGCGAFSFQNCLKHYPFAL